MLARHAIGPLAAFSRRPMAGAALAAAMVVCLSTAAPAAPYDDAVAAYKAGDFSTAVGLFLPLARDGMAEAQFDLGVIFLRGEGVTVDPVTAAEWFARAAKQGHADAQVNLGLMYQRGDGVPQDFEKAARYFQQAADQGHAKARNDLAILYARGQGVPRDPDRAAGLFAQAAEQGHTIAQINMAFAYQKGEGVPQDDVEAYRWFFIAAQVLPTHSRAQVEQWMQVLAARMGTAQVSVAENRAQAWLSGN